MSQQPQTPANSPFGLCPQCDKPAIKTYKPFCSKRCADVDLGHWLTGTYVLPGDSEVPDPIEDDS